MLPGFWRITPFVAALFLSSQQALAQTVSTIHGGETWPLTGGVLFTLRGCVSTPQTSEISDVEILRILYAVPGMARGQEWGGGGSAKRYVVAAAFRTVDGGTVVADSVILVDGNRAQIGRSSFDLEAGNLFVVHVMEGPDRVRQAAIEFVPDADLAARMDAIQRALPRDSLVQGMAPRYESYEPSRRGLTSVCTRRAQTPR
jgi:hypothetical protein